jgi:sugar diacid utilization regulator
VVPLRAELTRAPDELHDLIRRAYRTRQTRARLIVSLCIERLPHYQEIPESLLAEVRKSVLHHLEIFYRVTLETGRPLTDENLATSLRTARLRASQGVPLGEFLTFFLVGLTMAWEHLMATVGDDPALRSQLLDRVAAVISNQTQLMTALTEAYVKERERLSRFREQGLDDFFQLLPSDEAMGHALEARARTLGIPLGESRAIAVFGLGTMAESERSSVGSGDFQRELAGHMSETEFWVGRSPEGFVALLPQEPDPEVLAATAESLLGDGGRVGVGSPGRDIAGLRRSAREALRALEIGAMLGQTKRAHRYADLAIFDLVGVGSPDAEAFMRGVLGPLAATGASGAYLETLRQLCANGYRIKLAAAALSIHPHTLSYRVKQIRRRFGIDLDEPDVRLRVHLALLILDAQGPAPDAP